MLYNLLCNTKYIINGQPVKRASGLKSAYSEAIVSVAPNAAFGLCVTLEKPLIRRLLARLLEWASATPTRHRVTLIGLAVVLSLLLYGGSQALRLLRRAVDSRSQAFTRWFTGSEEEREALVTVRREACPGAPFILPADGYIGLLYGDSRSPYSAAHLHQGIDIFSDGPPGRTPVYAAYDGYVSRESG